MIVSVARKTGSQKLFCRVSAGFSRYGRVANAAHPLSCPVGLVRSKRTYAKLRMRDRAYASGFVNARIRANSVPIKPGLAPIIPEWPHFPRRTPGPATTRSGPRHASPEKCSGRPKSPNRGNWLIPVWRRGLAHARVSHVDKVSPP